MRAPDAAAAADVAVVSIPLHAIWDIDTTGLDGKVVLETNNYYPVRDGRIGAIDEERATTTGLPTSSVRPATFWRMIVPW